MIARRVKFCRSGNVHEHVFWRHIACEIRFGGAFANLLGWEKRREEKTSHGVLESFRTGRYEIDPRIFDRCGVAEKV